MAKAKSPARPKGDLTAIRKRLREGSLTAADVRKLETIVKSVDKSIKNLRAAIVE